MVYTLIIYTIISLRVLRLMPSSLSTGVSSSNALPFNLVHFPEGDYPGKLTQREIICKEELCEHLDCPSE